MRIRWQGLELPSRLTSDSEVGTDKFGRFVIEPFEQGFGTTIGNSLRRVLLSSLDGAAVTSVKIEGVSHEFASIDGVLEDVTDIILNIKGIVLRLDGDEPKTVILERNTAGEVRVGDGETDPAVTLVNTDHVIATLTADVPFRAELLVGKGRGYVTSVENRQPEEEIGVLPVDSIFSPVQRVRYRTEEMRVGQRTNYDRLIMDVWTNGTISPHEAVVEAGLILRKHLSAIVMCSSEGDDQVLAAELPMDMGDADEGAADEFLDRSVAALNLSVRSSNCLDAAQITTIRQLAELSGADLLRFRSFGKTSLHEVQRKLEEIGLSLGGVKAEDTPDDICEAPGEMPIADASPDVNATPGAGALPDAGEMQAYTMGD